MISEGVYRRSKCGAFYVRVRIPAEVLFSFGHGKTHITRCLKTTDIRMGKIRAHARRTQIEADFEDMRQHRELAQ